MCSSHWPKRAPPQWLSSVKKGYQQLQNTVSSNGFVDQFIYLMFCSSHFSLLGFGHFCEVTKILRNLCLHFARQDGQDGKKAGKKITQLN